jgi:Bacterial extracellular solute-binding protein
MRLRTWMLTLSLVTAWSMDSLQAAEITVLAGMGNVSGINDLAPAFERASGHKVVVRFVPAGDLPGVINSNAPADVLTAGPRAIDDFIAGGKVVAGNPRPKTPSFPQATWAALAAASFDATLMHTDEFKAERLDFKWPSPSQKYLKFQHQPMCVN